MSVERTQAGTWRARWREGADSRSRNFPTKRAALDHLASLRVDQQQGAYVTAAASSITVEKWADLWLAGAMNLSPGGRDTYRRDLDRYIVPALGDHKLSDLTAATIDAYLSDQLERLAPTSVLRHYRTIRRMLRIAVDRNRLVRNPCDAVTPPKAGDAEMRFLLPEEIEALADAISERYRAWVLGSAYLGWRWSEGVGLRRAHVLDDRVMIREQLIRRPSKEWERSTPKTRAGRRTVTMPPFLAEVMAGHLERWSLPGDDGLVFPNKLGHPMLGPTFTGSVFKPALVRAGLDRATRIHDLRHTAVALAIAAGAHSKTIQMRLGHASIAITLDRYGHLFPELDGQVADGLEKLRPT